MFEWLLLFLSRVDVAVRVGGRLQSRVSSCSQPDGACCSRSHDNAKEKGDKQYQSRDAKLQLSFKMPFTLT